jgi:hypothetical protein
MDEAVDARVTLTAQDLELGHQEMPENVLLRRLRAVFLASGLVFLATRISWAGLRASSLVQVLPFTFLALVYWWLVRRAGPGRRWAAALRPGEDEMRYRFDADGIRISSIRSDFSLRYEAVHRYVEGKSALLLYTQPRIAQIIPKRAFSAEQLERIRSWLSERVQERTPARTGLGVGWRIALWAALTVALLAVWQWLTPPR